VTTTVNEKTLRYAFECKNHKKGISLKDIGDFHQKIEAKSVSGYFVTTGSYQSGAVKKAAALGIELLILSERAPGPDDIAGIYLFKKQYEITEVSFVGSSPELDEPTVKKALGECAGCRKSLCKIFNEMIIPYLSINIDKAIEQVAPQFSDVRMMSKTLGKENAHSYQVVSVHKPGTTVTHQGKYVIEITHALTTIKVWHEKVKAEMIDSEHFIYGPYNKDSTDTLFSKSEFLIADKKMVVCISRSGENAVSRNILISEADMIPSAIPQKGFEIGSVNDPCLGDLFKQ
jgi:hypothetical protein